MIFNLHLRNYIKRKGFPFKSLTSVTPLMINECENIEMIEPREFKMQKLNFLLHQNYPTHHSYTKDKLFHWLKSTWIQQETRTS